MKFVDIKNDVAFRKIFGNEKKTKILISFLNAILGLEGNEQIKEVKIANPYQFPRVAGEKASIIDVRAIDKKSRQFVVEMQVADVDGFDKRVQYYTCRDYSMQIDRGEKYPLLKPTYFVGILDFNYFESESYLSHHIIINGETYEHKLKDIQFTFIELEKFTLKVDELNTLIEKWVFFIKKSEDLDVIPDHVDDEGLKEAYKDADRHTWKKEELIAYDNASIAEQDMRGKMKFVVDKRNKEIVESCIEENISIEKIEKITNIPKEKILQIIEELGKRKP